jgi:hypothetical protein
MMISLKSINIISPMNNFNDLAKLALNEGTISDYLNAAKAAKASLAPKKLAKSAAKGVIKGAAAAPGRAVQGLGMLGQLAGKAIQGAGAVYGALGGTQGAALANKVGGAVAGAGKGVANVGGKIAAAPGQINTAIKTVGQEYEQLQPVKDYIKKIYPGLRKDQFATINGANSLQDLQQKIKKSVPSIQWDRLMDGFYRQSQQTEQQPDQQAAQQPEQATNTTTGINARTPEGNPVPGQTRFTTADKKKTYMYGRNGWMLQDPTTKKWSAVQQQAQVTAAWQKSQNITPAAKPAAATQPTQPAPTQPSKKAVRAATQTKAGVPVQQPTDADLASMNLPAHPLTSKTPPNVRR